MTVTSNEISIDAKEAVASPAMRSDDPLSLFLPESQKTQGESADSVVFPKDAMQRREPSAQSATPSTNSADDRTTELVIHLKRALGALDVARDLARGRRQQIRGLKGLRWGTQGSRRRSRIVEATNTRGLRHKLTMSCD